MYFIFFQTVWNSFSSLFTAFRDIKCLWLYLQRISFSSWQKPVWKASDKHLSRLTDSEANRQRKTMTETQEVHHMRKYRGRHWPEVWFFWIALLLWPSIGLFQGSGHHFLVLLWVWWTGGVHHGHNLRDYTQTCMCALCQWMHKYVSLHI